MNQKQYNQYIKTHMTVQGKWLRKRPIAEIAKRLKATQKRHITIQNTQWTPWFKKSATIGSYHGTHNNQIKIFSFSSYNPGYGPSFHIDTLSPGKDYPKLKAQITPDENIPLLMADPAFNDHRDIIEKRLNKSLPNIPPNQELTDQYYKMEIQLSHIYVALELYQNILLNYVKTIEPELTRPWKSTTPTILILNIDGDPYHFVWNKTLSLITNIKHRNIPPGEMMK